MSMLKLSSALAVAAGSLALAACGGSGGSSSSSSSSSTTAPPSTATSAPTTTTTPSTSSTSSAFDSGAAQACESFKAQTQKIDMKLQTTKSASGKFALLGQLADDTDSTRAQLAKLTPPSAQSSSYQSFLGDLKDLSATLRKEKSDLSSRNVSAAKKDVAKLQSISQSASTHAGGLPALSACAGGSSNGGSSTGGATTSG